MESVTEQELWLFLILFHRSPLSSKSDLMLIFHSTSHSSAFKSVIFKENDSFSKLVNQSKEVKSTTKSTFDSTKEEKEWGGTIWGRRIWSNYCGVHETETTRLSYCAVVSFVVEELDPYNSPGAGLQLSVRSWCPRSKPPTAQVVPLAAGVRSWGWVAALLEEEGHAQRERERARVRDTVGSRFNFNG